MKWGKIHYSSKKIWYKDIVLHSLTTLSKYKGLKNSHYFKRQLSIDCLVRSDLEEMNGLKIYMVIV